MHKIKLISPVVQSAYSVTLVKVKCFAQVRLPKILPDSLELVPCVVS